MNAAEESRIENEALIDTESFQQAGRGFRETDEIFGETETGFGINPFGNNNNEGFFSGITDIFG